MRNSLNATFSKSQKLHYARTWSERTKQFSSLWPGVNMYFCLSLISRNLWWFIIDYESAGNFPVFFYPEKTKEVGFFSLSKPNIQEHFISHCFFIIRNIKRKGAFQFCFPGQIEKNVWNVKSLFWENPQFLLWLTWIVDLTDLRTCCGYF